MLVPTMGALHDGHLALVQAAKRVPGAVVVVSIFVNPLQFGAGEDLDAYPRTLEATSRLPRRGRRDRVHPHRGRHVPRRATHDRPSRAARARTRRRILGQRISRACSPSCSKLLQIVRPDRAFFGEKDYQQLVLVRQMVDDLNLDTRIVGVPIVREPDGLAMSSRNRYLDADAARAGRRAVGGAAGRHVRRGAGPAEALDAARAVLDEVPAIEVDYLEVRDTGLGPAPGRGAGRLLVAARLGRTRLLDNIAIDVGLGRRQRRRQTTILESSSPISRHRRGADAARPAYVGDRRPRLRPRPR